MGAARVVRQGVLSGQPLPKAKPEPLHIPRQWEEGKLGRVMHPVHMNHSLRGTLSFMMETLVDCGYVLGQVAWIAKTQCTAESSRPSTRS